MENRVISSPYMALLNSALARELQVSIQYMLQHGIGVGRRRKAGGGMPPDRQSQFIASHALYFLPGPTLKKIAITEMRHAEAIVERIVLLGGEPTTQPTAISIGDTVSEMLDNDLAQEQIAIDLYTRIIDVAHGESDGVTMNLFQKILADEKKHQQALSALLDTGVGRGDRG